MDTSLTALHASSSLAPKAPSLPISSRDVLSGLSAKQTIHLEEKHGNGDLMKVLQILGIGGPFRVINPWELEDETGRQLINAGGYAALPFGEMHPELVSFIQAYLE